MKETYESKTWTIEHRYGDITLEFTKEVDIHKAFDAMKAAASDNAAWLDTLCDSVNGIIKIGFYSGEFSDAIPTICKAVAKTFSDDAFKGTADFDDTRCFWIDSFEFSYDGMTLKTKETFMDDDHGYFCPECGAWVLPPYAANNYEDDEEIECDDCEEVFKLSDLKYVPPMIEEKAYSFK